MLINGIQDITIENDMRIPVGGEKGIRNYYVYLFLMM
jgi:hypothetical protein